MEVDLSVVVNIFREGRLIHATLVSLSDALVEVSKRGWTCEVILVLDRTDLRTLDYLDEHLERFFSDVPVYELHVQNGDLGLSRNSGLRFSRGRFVAFTDDDNLYSPNWLAQAVDQLESSDDVIVHPAYVVQFEGRNVLWKTIASDDPAFHVRSMVEHNYWDAACVAPRRVFEQVPYAPSLAGPGFGPEDWHWNCETLAAGWSHAPVANTVMFYRVKATGSLLARLDGAGALLAPTSLLRGPLAERVSEELFEAPARVDDLDVIDSVEGGGAERVLEETADVHNVVGHDSPAFTVRRFDRGRSMLLAGVRAAARPFAHALRRVSRIHPRAATFTDAITLATWDLVAPPRRTPLQVEPPPSVLIPGHVEHAEPPADPILVPEWVMDAWKAAHVAEPALFPERSVVESLLPWSPSGGPFTSAYWFLNEQLTFDEGGLDYLFLVPWLSAGGATTVVNNYVNAIRQASPDARIVVLSTSVGSPAESSNDDPRTRYVDVPEEVHLLRPAQQDQLIATLIIQLQPKVVHLINSPVGFRAFESYSTQLAVASRLYVSLFTLDESPEGRRTHYVLDAVRAYFDSLSGVFVDNPTLASTLVETYGLQSSKFISHHQPPGMTAVEALGTEHARERGSPLRVLWAARLDRQKRPDILVEISRRMRGTSPFVEFYASGAPVLDQGTGVLERFAEAGITYLGPYQSTISTLPYHFDVLLLTSQWEGLPLTIVDAALNRLTIVAPAVGGVPDFVADGVTGYLVDRFDDLDAYVDVLQRLAADPDRLDVTRENAFHLASARHGWDSFVAALEQTTGYLA
jgi:glycosyltransferase involved in cell wall biosynthesis